MCLLLVATIGRLPSAHCLLHTAVQTFLTAFPSASADRLAAKVNFLQSLLPLSVTCRLSLGPAIDCHIGVEKPITKAQLQEFLGPTPLLQATEQWLASSEIRPVPIYLGFSCLRPQQQVSFYVFGGYKAQNYAKVRDLFECLQTAVPPALTVAAAGESAEDLRAVVQVTNGQVAAVGCQLNNLKLSPDLLGQMEIQRRRV